MTGESPAQCPRSALGYTARRCGEAGPALVARRLRILFAIGVEQRSPRWDGRKAAAVSDRLSQPFQRPDRPGMVLAAKHRFGFCGGSWRSGSPATGCTDSSSAPGRTRPQGLEAKVRRYTGTRCICPALSMRQRGRTARDAHAMDGGCGSCGERIDGCGRFVRMNARILEGRCGRTSRRQLQQRSRRPPGG